MMSKALALVVAFLFVAAVTARESCNLDSECTGYIIGYHCCEDDLCYAQDENCPIVQLAGGIIAAIVVGVLVFIGIIVTIIVCCCCACCRTSSPGSVVVTQPPYQQFGVTTTTTNTQFHPPPVPPQQYGYPQSAYVPPPQPQMKPV